MPFEQRVEERLPVPLARLALSPVPLARLALRPPVAALGGHADEAFAAHRGLLCTLPPEAQRHFDEAGC